MDCEVFISYKCTDDQGQKTPDFTMAEELYQELTALGYQVFFSSNTLEQLGSSRYKTAIDSALDTAKIMVVVLSRPEYALSQWVQYEWDSFYNDYLSGVREEANLFTLTSNFDVRELPRTLRNIQNFEYRNNEKNLCEYIKRLVPRTPKASIQESAEETEKRTIRIISGKQVTMRDIREAVQLDTLVYDDIYHVDFAQCEQWFEVNPDIYVMARDDSANKVIAYVNISPVTEECYDRIRNGDFIDTGITADMLLSYDMPFPYSVYFSSIVIHPDYQNTEVFMQLYNAVVKRFLSLGEQEVYIKRMIADAVTKSGEKFCKLFGMSKIKGSDHNSTLYEVTLIPPKFRILSKATKQLWDYYQSKYTEAPYLFDC